MKKQQNQKPLIIYPPGIEARREKYMRVGRAIRDLRNMQFNSVHETLDICAVGL